MNSSRPVLLFDGVCNLCNGVVQFVLKNDRRGVLQFASQQSESGVSLLERHKIPPMQGVVLLEGETVFTGSDAALRLFRHLGSGWGALEALRILPRPLREFVYGFIAQNRYKLFGKRESCMVPRAEWKGRFLV